MGRYYSGDIEGKFMFAVQSSDAATQFGAYPNEPTYITYDFYKLAYKEEEYGEGNFKVYKLLELIEKYNERLDKLNSYFTDLNKYFNLKKIDIDINGNIEKQLMSIDEEDFWDIYISPIIDINNAMLNARFYITGAGNSNEEKFVIAHKDIFTDWDRSSNNKINKCAKDLEFYAADIFLGFKIFKCIVEKDSCYFECEL